MIMYFDYPSIFMFTSQSCCLQLFSNATSLPYPSLFSWPLGANYASLHPDLHRTRHQVNILVDLFPKT